MIQCKDCDLAEINPDGSISFKCNPFKNIKEPECISKWQLIKLDALLSSQQIMLNGQNKLAPIQEKIIKYVEREIDDISESDSWKYDDEDDSDTNF